jgi:hypothetical protein
MSEIRGKGIPLSTTKGSIGDYYIDTNTGEKYRCIFSYTAAVGSGKTEYSYVWHKVMYTVSSIGDSAFDGCTNLTSIRFLGTPTKIATSAFSGCTNLKEIKVPWSEGAVANAPWGATNATVTYDYTG